MSAVHNPIESYVLGNTLQEQERLKLQGRFLEKWTEQFFLSAGLEPGMNVLDLGCGMGDVSLLAARLVGPTGRVTGIDRDPVVIAKARQRARDEGGGSEIEFVQAELLKFRSDQKFDAVVGRYVLFFSPTRSPQSFMQQNKFARAESLSSMKWTWPIAFQATRTAHSLQRFLLSSRKRTGSAVSGRT